MSLLNFEVSAPGKIILHGEHSVVYGKPALATTIGIRTHLKCQENNSSTVKFHFENLNFVLSVTLAEANTFIQNLKEGTGCEMENSINTVRDFVENILQPIVTDCATLTASISTFYLLADVFSSSSDPKIRKGFDIHLISDLKIGAGLGSSASFSVCLAAAFLVLSRTIYISPSASISAATAELISDFALQCESVIHINPSGIDNTVCTYGNILKFQKGENFERLNLQKKLNILLVDSKVTRSTATLVTKVSGIKDQFPHVTDSIFNALEEVVNEAFVLYQNYSTDDLDTFKKLQSLFQINNDLLKALGVSHASLEIIFSIASNNGFTSKLTGAGGGGFAIVLLPDNYENNPDYTKMCTELTQNNFDYINTTIGEYGVALKEIYE